MSSLNQEYFDVFVVGDDAVVNQEELVVLVTPLGVTVHLVRRTVGCPPGVSDTNVTVQRVLKLEPLFISIDLILQHLHLALLLQDEKISVISSIKPHPGRVVAAILQSLESSDQQLQDLLPTLRCEEVEVGKYPTHDGGVEWGEKKKYHNIYSLSTAGSHSHLLSLRWLSQHFPVPTLTLASTDQTNSRGKT